MSNTKAINPAEGLTGWQNNRWLQLTMAIAIMILVSGVEYGWSKYTVPLASKLNAPLDAIQYAFTIGLIGWGIGQPSVGLLADKYGPKWIAVVCSLFVGVGWIMMGKVDSLAGLYVWYFLAGLGGGTVEGIAIGVATKWFPDKRGLANGLSSAGFGSGSLVFLPIITSSLKTSVDLAFLNTGVAMLIVCTVLSFFLKYPASSLGSKKVINKEDLTPKEVFKTTQFWVMYATFLGMNCGGLMLTANSVPYAKSIGISAAFVTMALTAQNIANGGSRIFWGWASDYLGRDRSMAISFGLNALAFFLFPTISKFGQGWGFVVITFMAFLTWGCIMCLFPSKNADVFGSSYSTTTYGVLFTSKSVGGVFGGGVAAAISMTLGWGASFYIGGALALFSFAMAAFVLPRFGKQTRVLTDSSSKSHAS